MVRYIGSENGDLIQISQKTGADGVPDRELNTLRTVSDRVVMQDEGSYLAGYFQAIATGGGDDTITGENMIWLNAGTPTIAFGFIDAGVGNDYVSLYRSAAREINAGDGNDTVIGELTGGAQVDMGAGDDLTRIGGEPGSTVSNDEIYQKHNAISVGMDGGVGVDTLNLQGDWTLTLSSGSVTIDTDGDGRGDLITDIFDSSMANMIIGFPSVLNGTVTWGTVTAFQPGYPHITVEIANDSVFSNYEHINAVCFTAGTEVATPNGRVNIERLREGDLVMTRNGPQPVRWIGRRRLDSIDLAGNPKIIPIRVAAGAFGNGLPRRDICFSPQHRVLIRSPIAERMFGTREVLAPVKQLLGVDGIEIAGDARKVEYVHIMFAEHQLVEVEGIEAESLYPGKQALSFLSDDQLNELREIFPNFDEIAQCDYPSADHIPFLKGREARSLAARHMKNGRPFYC
ncbi:Hint domain-containing protein [Paracoccus sp. SCSIO 75233]|uniref:Hint domain-containing protein n=1 Tax=Paracoccus sp. SCSIO 75233 TaxID=3017782 RepID=UPI0022F057EC|nr:Hint domain-containing protein [Paracoccus sp. SCSIO 75233]WBU55204.1 Hint domain-containing protein [Paracoccus sp. SCSIO 75233]